MTLGEKLYTLRTKQNMTQEQLAEKLQISASLFPNGNPSHTPVLKNKISGRVLSSIIGSIIR